jgi:hypothetical protein
MKFSVLRFVVLAWLLAPVLENPAHAAVGVAVTPAVTSNTYPGMISLTITGLTNYQQVKVQTYLDLNGNGVVDAGEPLMDVFNLKESGVTTVGGITNLSVPYDSNPATSAITASLSFALPLDNIAGQKIYRVISNPGGAFTPVTAVLSVTNAVLGQAVSGVVYSNGVTPLPNAVVVALTLTNQNYVASTVADAAGYYYLALSPGYYLLLPTLPGYFTDQSRLPQVALTSGVNATNDLTLTNGLVTVGGTVFDASTSNTLGGVFLQGQSGNLFAITFTDTNGNYTLGANTGNWKLKTPAERLSRRGYLALQSTALTASTALGSVTNANIGLYRGNNLFYGQLTISNNPVANVAIEANDDTQIYSSKGYTDANGNYALATLVNTNALPSGTTWYCSPSPNGAADLFSRYIFNYADQISFGSNQVANVNFAGLPVTTAISGRLVNNRGVPLVGVGVGGNASVNGLQYVTGFVDTDTNGDFTVAAAAGFWYVNANCCGNHSLQEQNYYEPDSANVTVPPAATNLTLVAYPASEPVLGQPLRVSNSQFDFNLYGANGNNYTIQGSTNLAVSNWATLYVISNLSGSPFFIQDNQATNTARYYRVFQGP